MNCGDGRFLAVAAVSAFVCLLVGDAGFVLVFLTPLLWTSWLKLWEKQKILATRLMHTAVHLWDPGLHCLAALNHPQVDIYQNYGGFRSPL